MATYTTNLNLEKPATSENFNLSKINSNWDKIDAGYGENKSLIGSLKTFALSSMSAGAGSSVKIRFPANTVYLIYTFYGANARVSSIYFVVGNSTSIAPMCKEVVTGADISAVASADGCVTFSNANSSYDAVVRVLRLIGSGEPSVVA
jgi:hypothetical protein